MKRISLYEIRDHAKESGRMVFSIQQLANLLSVHKKIAKVYASRLVKKELAKRILRGKISFTEDSYIIATQLIEPSYISLHSALLFHGIIKQVPKYITCVTSKNSLNYPSQRVVYHKINPNLFFGYKRYNKNGSYIFVANAEKAIVDGLYLNLFNKQQLNEYSGKINLRKLKKIVLNFEGRGHKKLKRMIL